MSNSSLNLQEFANRVLFSNSLEEKLTPAGLLDDSEEYAAIATPSQPGRPPDLRIRKDGVRADFPSLAHLDNEEQRGIVLHFLANHELLATELMALVLLKFPQAPKSFRRGVLRTLQEEQEHTKLYMERMEVCGIRFGDLPVNQFFWKSVAPMETPLDYVTRLSLTFEQANLDYSRYFGSQFRQAGDLPTAEIMEKIYHDEIAHVGYGLKWFRRWKSESDTDWEAFRKQLHFPLGPARAKSDPHFNAEGRQKAGLKTDFIHELAVFSQSRGRTPNVWLFNPTAESHVAGETPPEALEDALMSDLGTLPMFLARQDDIVVTRQLASKGFLQKLRSFGFALPEFKLLEKGIPLAFPDGRKLNSFKPWACSPDSERLLEPLRPLLPDPTKPGWQPALKSLYSKCWAVEMAEQFGQIHSQICTSVSACEEILKPGSNWVLKAPFGTAGNGLRTAKNGTLSEQVIPWLERVLASQMHVIVEPWHERVLDFSVQYDCSPSGTQFLGYIEGKNSSKGQFQAVTARSKFVSGLPRELARFLGENALLDRYKSEIPEAINATLAPLGYEGALGIDAYIYRENGSLKLRNIVEINLRHTMGRVVHELRRQVHPGATVQFELFGPTALKKSKANSFLELAELIEDSTPIVLDTRSGLIRSGSLALTDPIHARRFLATMKVGN